MRIPALLLATAAIIVPYSRAEEAKTYKINLHQPAKVGAVIHQHFKFKLTRSLLMTVGEKSLGEKKEDLNAELSGMHETLEASPHGKVLKLKFTVEKFSVQENTDAAQEPFKEGTILTGSIGANGKAIYSSSDGEVPSSARKVLEQLFSLAPDRPDEATDDMVFRTDEPRAVGSEWEMNKAEAIKSMSPDMPFKVSEKELSGTTRFPSVKLHNGKEHYDIHSEVTMKPAEVGNMPPEFKLGSMKLTARRRVLVPADEKTSVPLSEHSYRMEMAGSMESPNGKMDLKSLETREISIERRATK